MIQMRYLKEVLTNRAGSTLNWKFTGKVIKETCQMPYTDVWIMPNGKMGICCCDNFEVIELADLNNGSLVDGWNSEEYHKLCETISTGRQNYDFCKYCNFMDAAEDEINPSEKLHGAREALHE